VDFHGPQVIASGDRRLSITGTGRTGHNISAAVTLTGQNITVLFFSYIFKF
jgi:hypothetical protein